MEYFFSPGPIVETDDHVNARCLHPYEMNVKTKRWLQKMGHIECSVFEANAGIRLSMMYGNVRITGTIPDGGFPVYKAYLSFFITYRVACKIINKQICYQVDSLSNAASRVTQYPDFESKPGALLAFRKCGLFRIRSNN